MVGHVEKACVIILAGWRLLEPRPGSALYYYCYYIQNRAGRVITGSSYDVRSADVLNNLKRKTLKTRRFHTKATLMYKILNDLSAPN